MEFVLWRRRRLKIDGLRDETSLFNWFSETEVCSPFFGAGLECPLYVLSPPTFRQREDWAALLQHLPISSDTLGRLLAHGFMPLDVELLERRTLSEWRKTLGISDRHTLIDCDYGIVSRMRNNQLGNLNLDSDLIERYIPRMPFLASEPQAILSLGAVRGTILLGQMPTSFYPPIPTLRVATRAELDTIIEAVSRRAEETKLQIWYRGQPEEYLLADLIPEANDLVCPWRSVRDPSLVPSLYRNAWKGNGALSDYCTLLSDLELYTLHASSHLDLVQYTRRNPAEDPAELLPEHFGPYSTGPTAKVTDSKGNIMAVRDYHPGFHGLQKSFFLQHYGLPSPILDITHSVDVALFFAQNRVRGRRMVPVDGDSRPILYLFALDPTIDRFVNSARLLQSHELLRPRRQSCGLLAGATFITRNFYSRFISILIELTAPIDYDPALTPQYLFPDRSDDAFLRFLAGIADGHFSSIPPSSIRPFELEA